MHSVPSILFKAYPILLQKTSITREKEFISRFPVHVSTWETFNTNLIHRPDYNTIIFFCSSASNSSLYTTLLYFYELAVRTSFLNTCQNQTTPVRMSSEKKNKFAKGKEHVECPGLECKRVKFNACAVKLPAL